MHHSGTLERIKFIVLWVSTYLQKFLRFRGIGTKAIVFFLVACK
jgi:hypothetical protein